MRTLPHRPFDFTVSSSHARLAGLAIACALALGAFTALPAAATPTIFAASDVTAPGAPLRYESLGPLGHGAEPGRTDWRAAHDALGSALDQGGSHIGHGDHGGHMGHGGHGRGGGTNDSDGDNKNGGHDDHAGHSGHAAMPQQRDQSDHKNPMDHGHHDSSAGEPDHAAQGHHASSRHSGAALKTPESAHPPHSASHQPVQPDQPDQPHQPLNPKARP